MKTNTTVSVDEFLLTRAREKGVNVSGMLNDALRIKLNPLKKDAPEDALMLICTQCGTPIDYGYFCKERNLFLCQSCQDNFKMSQCLHNKIGEHSHIRIPGYDDQNLDLIKEIEKIKKEIN